MTQDTEDVVARLRRKIEIARSPSGIRAIVPVNPDGAEAADLIQSLSDRIDVLEGALRALYQAEKVHDPDDWRGEPAMIQAWEALGRPQ